MSEQYGRRNTDRRSALTADERDEVRELIEERRKERILEEASKARKETLTLIWKGLAAVVTMLGAVGALLKSWGWL